MPIVIACPDIEGWLESSAANWVLASDAEYRSVVARWTETFADIIERGAGLQGPIAMKSLEKRLPSDLLIFNGISVERVAHGVQSHPSLYRASGLRSIDHTLANEHDMIIVDEAFSYCCVCTHEWQALVHPIFVQRLP